MKKKYKLVILPSVKKQLAKLPAKDRAGINKALKKVLKNPEHAPNSMSVFGKPSAAELKQWMSGTKASTVDEVMEYLYDKHCLTKSGVKLARDFCEAYCKD